MVTSMGLRTSAQALGFMKAASSRTTKSKPSPRRLSGVLGAADGDHAAVGQVDAAFSFAYF